MIRIIFSGKILALAGLSALVAAWCLCPGVSQAQAEVIRHSTSGDLFYNYYVPPVGEGSVGAQLYLCPRPTPPLVGHTYFTYQPLMPHEYLYGHCRVYKTVHTDAPPTRTSVHWGTGIHVCPYLLPTRFSLTPGR
jgi:hypothetical protein